MLKRTIKFTDYNGTDCQEDHFFNLTQTELIELEVNYEDGLGAALEAIVAAKDQKALLAIFKKLVLLSYGQKSADGKSFRKSDEMREEFSQTSAYDALFTELAVNESAAADFIKGIVPANMGAAMDQQQVARIVAEGQPLVEQTMQNYADHVSNVFSTPPPPPSAFEAKRVDL